MPAVSPFGVLLFALQAAVGYAAYRSLRGSGPVAALVVDAVAVGLAAVAGGRAEALPART